MRRFSVNHAPTRLVHSACRGSTNPVNSHSCPSIASGAILAKVRTPAILAIICRISGSRDGFERRKRPSTRKIDAFVHVAPVFCPDISNTKTSGKLRSAAERRTMAGRTVRKLLDRRNPDESNAKASLSTDSLSRKEGNQMSAVLGS